MKLSQPIPFRAPLAEYEREAAALLVAVQSREEAAEWRFKWLHPRFRGKPVAAVGEAALELADAQAVVAQEYGFATWADLVAFTHAVAGDGPVVEFESAIEAVVSGDVTTLRGSLEQHPDLARRRSTRRHHATLLHYVAANGVEQARQKTPPNALEVARALLEAGAEVDALADMYDQRCTTMSMLVSSAHPAQAGLQSQLAELLLDYGAALDGPGSKWQSALMTALVFGYLNTAETLARRGAPVTTLAAAAGLGHLAEAARLYPSADQQERHIAMALSAQHGQTSVVKLLLEAGEDPNRYNPEGFHAHSTPLHQAVCAGHAETVRLLVERRAHLDVRDKIYEGTPLGWAIHCQQTDIAEYLRTRGAGV
jgi:ankyrin repeat protein